MTDDRTPSPVRFTFEGRSVEATPGQTLGGALHADGVRILTRSFKYRRPRGYTCGYGACGNCPLTVDGLPGVNACERPVEGGEDVRRERGWPSAGVDIFRASDAVAPLLTAGFQFRLFTKRPRLAHLSERVMAWVAGAGRLPTPQAAAAVRATTHETRAVDVTVVGGGLSGLAAALGAAADGASVLLVHRGALGGRSLGRTSTAAGRTHTYDSDRDAALALAGQVEEHPRIEVLDGTAVATFDGVDLIVVSRRRRIRVTTPAMVVATGSYDVPLAFAGNDKPGVMLASAVRRLLHVEGVRPGRRAVVVAENATGYEIAQELLAAGVTVTAVVDPEPDARAVALVAPVAGAGVPVVSGRPVRVVGLRGARRVVVAGASGRRRLRADLVVVSRPERPAEELRWQRHYVKAGDTYAPTGSPAASASDTTVVVGSAAALPAQTLEDATDAGHRAARAALARRGPRVGDQTP
ncbi:(2Fe-2S)-binding protein [Mumia sp. ZJ1417]|uniref:(2Fe-2S)-binding protein n=1 Tax=Mumia sp. ZJ1417 TaxID=2708082 RepID=UPI001423AB43|nr:(2Fe-2S)-binding protein [Mumia sp. ZJ1417]QMW65386.1 (2Fe-2S)-binding protein [Mumia sp. ZJ1417]